MWYWNAAGERFPLPEPPLEPDDCWRTKKEAANENEQNNNDE